VKNSLPKHLVLLVAVLGCASGASAIANVRVEFVKPENYTDVSFRSMTPEGARERLIGELARTIKDSAAKPLSGYDLYVSLPQKINRSQRRVTLERDGALDCFLDCTSHLLGRGFTSDIAGSRSPAENGFYRA
jgi:hypothetical protein